MTTRLNIAIAAHAHRNAAANVLADALGGSAWSSEPDPTTGGRKVRVYVGQSSANYVAVSGPDADGDCAIVAADGASVRSSISLTSHPGIIAGKMTPKGRILVVLASAVAAHLSAAAVERADA